MSLNPSTDKFTIELGSDFYVNSLMEKYNDFLFHKNSQVKDLQSYMHESIQSIQIPGMNLQVVNVNGMSNIGAAGNVKTPAALTVNKSYVGNAPIAEIIESTTVTITFRNTIINWMYIYEFFRRRYERNSTLKNFDISVTLRDSADIPMLNILFDDCFISGLPGLEFSFNTGFRESKTFDIIFTFNKMNFNFIIPSFKKTNI